MTFAFSLGNIEVGFAISQVDVIACQKLRNSCFFGSEGLDRDEFDPLCRHLMIRRSGELIGTCRVMSLSSGSQIEKSYSAQSYDLNRFSSLECPLMEVGRFCALGVENDADVLRMLWAGLARMVDENKVGVLFGCSSFAGTDPEVYRSAFGYLGKRHLAPRRLRPGRKSEETVLLNSENPVDAKAARAELPPLVRSYLNLGAWFGDHAVVDHDMRTLHVFTALEVASVPVARARALRSILAEPV